MSIDLEELERMLDDENESWLIAGHVPALIAEARKVPELEAEVRRERALREEAEQRADICHHNHAAAIAAVRDENERLRAEVERRPDISPEDADGTIVDCALTNPAPSWPGGHEAALRIANALRAHAAKAVKPQCSCSRRLGDYCPDVDRACPLHGDAAKVSR